MWVHARYMALTQGVSMCYKIGSLASYYTENIYCKCINNRNVEETPMKFLEDNTENIVMILGVREDFNLDLGNLK